MVTELDQEEGQECGNSVTKENEQDINRETANKSSLFSHFSHEIIYRYLVFHYYVAYE